MQQLSNDTNSWTLIDASLPSALSYNSSTYDVLINDASSINDIHNPISILSFDSISSHAINLDVHTLNYWAFVLIIFPLFTIFGNVLVVISVYREKSLHTVTNYFVVSLAISDIAVAAVVMPFAIYLEVSRQ
jgi:hypothetical protein